MNAGPNTDKTAAQEAAQQVVDSMIAQRLSVGTARSNEYVAGIRCVLEYRALGRAVALPFAVGTAQADAWYAGLEEGNRLWREQAVEQAAIHPVRRQA